MCIYSYIFLDTFIVCFVSLLKYRKRKKPFVTDVIVPHLYFLSNNICKLI